MHRRLGQARTAPLAFLGRGVAPPCRCAVVHLDTADLARLDELLRGTLPDDVSEVLWNSFSMP